MFRINKAFQNESTEIIRIEGKITDENILDWEQEIQTIQSHNGREIILDFAQVWFISPKAVEMLLNRLNDRIYILNCGMEVRNLLHASGLSARMLE
jgi:anti-anti-sigma regulatory factor